MAQLKGTTFSRLASLLGERSAMTIGNNTTAERDGGAILIRLHDHAIVRLHEDSDELGNVDFTPVITDLQVPRGISKNIGGGRSVGIHPNPAFNAIRCLYPPNR